MRRPYSYDYAQLTLSASFLYAFFSSSSLALLGTPSIELQTEHVESAFEPSEEPTDRLLIAVATMWRIA